MSEPLKPGTVVPNAQTQTVKTPAQSDVVIILTRNDVALVPTLKKYLQFSEMLGAPKERIEAIKKVISSLEA